MEADVLHDLTAAYALDALDPGDARRYEAHLARCERCQGEFAELSETATALAYATDAPAPPAELRTRILDQARAERPNLVPLRPRWVKPLVAVVRSAMAKKIAYSSDEKMPASRPMFSTISSVSPRVFRRMARARNSSA